MNGSHALMVQAVAGVAKQQLADASEAAVKEKEAAVSKCIQSVQRRASKEALQQVCCFAFNLCLRFAPVAVMSALISYEA